MPTGQKLTELQVAALKKLFFSNAGKTDEDIAALAGCSVPTLRRYAKKYGWRTTREAAQATLNEAIEQTVPVGGASLDVDALLVKAIEDLSSAAAGAEVKSKEGAYRSLTTLLQLYGQRHPMSYRECIELMWNMPDFDPMELAKELRKFAGQNPDQYYRRQPTPPTAN